MNAGQCPATRGPQTCASIGPHARHIWTDPEPAREPGEDLVHAVARALARAASPSHPVVLTADLTAARAAITAVRAWDAEAPAGTTPERPATAPRSPEPGVTGPNHASRARGVPTCHGMAWTSIQGRQQQALPCTLPLGHHGGCR